MRSSNGLVEPRERLPDRARGTLQPAPGSGAFVVMTSRKPPTFRNESFEKLIEGTLKKTSAALRDAGIPYVVIGSLAAWVRGGLESSHDLDFGIRATDMIHAAEALEAVGLAIEIPPEDWLIKAWDGEPDTPEATLVDLIYAPSGMPITDEVLERADLLQVLAQWMPVLSATDSIVNKLLSLREQHLDYTSVVATARAIREQVDWAVVRRNTAHSPYARAFFTMAEVLGIAPAPGEEQGTVQVIAEMQAQERIGDEYVQERQRLAESLRQRRRAAPGTNGHADAQRAPEASRSAQTMA
jgi:hypothetical protein